MWPVILSHYHASRHFLPQTFNSSLIVCLSLPFVLLLTNLRAMMPDLWQSLSHYKSENIFIDYLKLSTLFYVLGP